MKSAERPCKLEVREVEDPVSAWYLHCRYEEISAMRVSVQKWGNSLALRIPKAVAQESHIARGSVVDLRLRKGELVVKPLAQPVYSLDQLLAAVSDENLHGEVDTGTPTGREAW
jgi:antitoxin MazE